MACVLNGGEENSLAGFTIDPQGIQTTVGR